MPAGTPVHPSVILLVVVPTKRNAFDSPNEVLNVSAAKLPPFKLTLLPAIVIVALLDNASVIPYPLNVVGVPLTLLQATELATTLVNPLPSPLNLVAVNTPVEGLYVKEPLCLRAPSVFVSVVDVEEENNKS
jgi:hypothetical protein